MILRLKLYRLSLKVTTYLLVLPRMVRLEGMLRVSGTTRTFFVPWTPQSNAFRDTCVGVRLGALQSDEL